MLHQSPPEEVDCGLSDSPESTVEKKENRVIESSV